MNSYEPRILIGCVEQALTDGYDPLLPPISVSLNGTLAKWRGKMQILDLRINDPGLRNYRAAFEDTLAKANALGIEPIVTLPELGLIVYDAPPETDQPSFVKTPPAKQIPLRGVPCFKSYYLAVPRTVTDPDAYHTLQVEDCLPILEMALKYKVRKIIVPVSEPGLFLDPIAADEFRSKFKELIAGFRGKGFTFHLRTGGLSKDLFSKIAKETGCFMALNVGMAHLERVNIEELYNMFADQISVLLLHQVLPGIDKWYSRKEEMAKALRYYLKFREDFSDEIKLGFQQANESIFNRLNSLYREYADAYRNNYFNLGLFQSGDINMVPLLKMIKKDLEKGKEKCLILETVPNIKNAEYLGRYVIGDSLPRAF